MGLGALLCSFWWMVGVTEFETPGIPYLLEEATVIYSSRLEWFLSTGIKTGIRFGFSAIICVVLGLILYKCTMGKKWTGNSTQFVISFSIYLTLFTIFFSFGQNLKILQYFLTCPPKVAPVSKLVINWYTDFERMGKLWQGKTIRWSRSS